MRELKQVLGKQKAFVVTDRFLFQSGTIHCITDQLHELGIAYQIFSDVEPDPTLACAKRGAEEMRAFARMSSLHWAAVLPWTLQRLCG